MLFVADQFFLSIEVALDPAFYKISFVVGKQAGDPDKIEIHPRHIVAALQLIVVRYGLVRPLPFVVGVGSLAFQDAVAAVVGLDEIVHIRLHKREQRVTEHRLDLVDTVSGLPGKDLGDQRFQQMPHFRVTQLGSSCTAGAMPRLS